jgi:hypothetical protein
MRKVRMTAAAGLALLVSVPARAEVAASSDAGFVIELAADSSAAPTDVWKTLIAPARWWNAEHTYSGDAANLYLDAQATGCFCEKLPVPADAPPGQRMGSVEHLHVIQADPARRVLRMTGALGPLQSEAVSGTLTVLITPKGGGSHIAWVYAVGGMMRFKPSEIAAAVDQVLADQLNRLATKAAEAGPSDTVRP